jgi:hypothetical protein
MNEPVETVHGYFFFFVYGCIRILPTFFISFFCFEYSRKYPYTSVYKFFLCSMNEPVERTYGLYTDCCFF